MKNVRKEIGVKLNTREMNPKHADAEQNLVVCCTLADARGRVVCSNGFVEEKVARARIIAEAARQGSVPSILPCGREVFEMGTLKIWP